MLSMSPKGINFLTMLIMFIHVFNLLATTIYGINLMRVYLAALNIVGD